MWGDETEMSVWFCKNLGDAMLAFQGLSRIKDAFQSAYSSTDCPDNAAVLELVTFAGQRFIVDT